MLIEKIKIRGLKGSATEQRFGALNLIQGPNGAGKSRLLDGILFVFGQDTAGVSAEGRNLASAMAGEELSSTVTLSMGDGELIDIERSRKRNRGTFSRSKLFVNGDERDSLDHLVGPFNPRKGRAMVDMSADALLDAVSEIGARCSEEAPGLILALEGAARAFERSWKPAPGPALERLRAVVSEISDWRKAQRKTVKEAAASQDRSRRDLGAARVSPGSAEAREKEAEEAARKERAASEAVGRHRAEAAQLSRQIFELSAKLEAAGSGGEDLAEAQARLDQLAGEFAVAKSAEASALAEKQAKASAHDELERSVQGSEDAIAELESGLSSRRAQAEHLSSAPCSRTTEWMALADQEGDPFAEPVDLCAACPFPASARKAATEMPALEQKIEELRTALEKVVGQWKVAADERLSALSAWEKASSAVISLDRQVRSTERAVSEARKAAGVSGEQKAEWRQKISSLEAEKLEAESNLRRASAELEARGAEKASAMASAREARVLEERLRRLRDDERRASEAEERLALIEKLDGQAKRVARVLAEAGEARILDLASPLVVAPWTLAFDDGRVGLRGENGDFWTGAGLSAAQREILFAALDFAQSLIDGERLRITMLEADPVDLDARTRLVSQLQEAVARGDLSQVFVCSWLPIEAGPEWTRIEVAPAESDPFAEPDSLEEEPDDPFAPPPYVAKVEESSGPELSAFLEMIRLARPGAFQKIPRRLQDRARLVLELAEEMSAAERSEVFGC